MNFDPFKAFLWSFCCFLDLYSSYLAVMTVVFLFSSLPFILRLQNFCPSEKPRRSVLACFSSVHGVKATSTERSDAVGIQKEALTHTSIEKITPQHITKLDLKLGFWGKIIMHLLPYFPRGSMLVFFVGTVCRLETTLTSLGEGGPCILWVSCIRAGIGLLGLK